MHYQGGKSRLAKDIAAVINQHTAGKDFYSLFVGAGNVEALINANHKHMNDLNFWLIEMHKKYNEGWLPAADFIKDYKNEIDHKHKIAMVETKQFDKGLIKALSFEVGYYVILLAGCSFCGKWRGGVARDSDNSDYYKRAIAHNLKLKEQGLYSQSTFTNYDYRDILSTINNSVVYADPPYAGTYGYLNRKFDSGQFWEDMRQLSKNNIVFISEMNAPEDFIPVKEFDYTRGMKGSGGKTIKVVEKLYICNGR